MGDLQKGLVQLSVNLRTVIGDSRAEIVQVSSAVQEIATGNHDLSSRTDSQASSLEQTAASMEEITGTVQRTATAAMEIKQLIGEASERVAAGGNQTNDARDRMHSAVPTRQAKPQHSPRRARMAAIGR